MKKRLDGAAKAAVLCATAVLAGCQAGGLESAQNAALDTDDQKASYAIGLQFGAQLAPAGDHLDMDAYLRGLQDALAGREPVIDQAELQTVVQQLNQVIREEQAIEAARAGERSQEEGAAYLAENATKEGVITTESGLQYEVLREGDGPKPTPVDQVTIHYRGTLVDGTEFDSSYGRGEPTTFGVGGVIAGFSEGLQLMSVGSQYRFVIPSELAYGTQGGGAIPPNATLIFEVELIEIPK